MQQVGQILLNTLVNHQTAIETAGGVLLFAFIHNWPEQVPHSFQDWWTWARNTFQSSIPIKQGAITKVLNPTSGLMTKEN